MSFVLLIKLCSQQVPILPKFPTGFPRSPYNPSVKWKSSENKVSFRFSRTLPLICAHLLISSSSSTILRAALSIFPIYLLRIVSRSAFLPPVSSHFCFRRNGGTSREAIFKTPERRRHRFSCFFFGPPAPHRPQLLYSIPRRIPVPRPTA